MNIRSYSSRRTKGFDIAYGVDRLEFGKGWPSLTLHLDPKLVQDSVQAQ